MRIYHSATNAPLIPVYQPISCAADAGLAKKGVAPAKKYESSQGAWPVYLHRVSRSIKFVRGDVFG
jgi:hypothetical protein